MAKRAWRARKVARAWAATEAEVIEAVKAVAYLP
jgi:hypothetical protein